MIDLQEAVQEARNFCQTKFDVMSNAVKAEFAGIDFDFSGLNALLAGLMGVRADFKVIRPSDYTDERYNELLNKVVLFIKQNFKKTYPHANKGWGLGFISVSAIPPIPQFN